MIQQVVEVAEQARQRQQQRQLRQQRMQQQQQQQASSAQRSGIPDERFEFSDEEEVECMGERTVEERNTAGFANAIDLFGNDSDDEVIDLLDGDSDEGHGASDARGTANAHADARGTAHTAPLHSCGAGVLLEKRLLGERILPRVSAIVGSRRAETITGMLLEMEVAEVRRLLTSPEALSTKIHDAIDRYRSHAAMAAASAASSSATTSSSISSSATAVSNAPASASATSASSSSASFSALSTTTSVASAAATSAACSTASAAAAATTAAASSSASFLEYQKSLGVPLTIKSCLEYQQRLQEVDSWLRQRVRYHYQEHSALFLNKRRDLLAILHTLILAVPANSIPVCAQHHAMRTCIHMHTHGHALNILLTPVCSAAAHQSHARLVHLAC